VPARSFGASASRAPNRIGTLESSSRELFRATTDFRSPNPGGELRLWRWWPSPSRTSHARDSELISSRRTRSNRRPADRNGSGCPTSRPIGLGFGKPRPGEACSERSAAKPTIGERHASHPDPLDSDCDRHVVRAGRGDFPQRYDRGVLPIAETLGALALIPEPLLGRPAIHWLYVKRHNRVISHDPSTDGLLTGSSSGSGARLPFVRLKAAPPRPAATFSQPASRRSWEAAPRS